MLYDINEITCKDVIDNLISIDYLDRSQICIYLKDDQIILFRYNANAQWAVSKFDSYIMKILLSKNEFFKWLLINPDEKFNIISSKGSIEIIDNIKMVNGDIFDTKLQTLAIPVNCVGVMGKGLALQCKLKYPEVYNEYEFLCKHGLLGNNPLCDEKAKPIYIVSCNDNRKILLCATKWHWKNNSSNSAIISILYEFKESYEKLGITSAAFPLLGCGCGNLDKTFIRGLLFHNLSQIKNMQFEIYNNEEDKGETF